MFRLIRCCLLCGLVMGPALAGAAGQYSFRPLEEESPQSGAATGVTPSAAADYRFAPVAEGGASLYSGPPHEQNNVVYQGYRFRISAEAGGMAGERPAPLEQAPSSAPQTAQGAPLPPGYFQPSAAGIEQTQAAGYEYRSLQKSPDQATRGTSGPPFPAYGMIPPRMPTW